MPTFIAYLPKSKSALRIDGDNQAEIKMVTSADQLPEVLKLTMFQGKAFKVKILDIEDSKGKPYYSTGLRAEIARFIREKSRHENGGGISAEHERVAQWIENLEMEEVEL